MYVYVYVYETKEMNNKDDLGEVNTKFATNNNILSNSDYRCLK